MSCNHPLKAFFTGFFTENHKPDYIIMPGPDDFLDVDLAAKIRHCKPDDLTFNRIVRNGHEFLVDPLDIPCGHCIGCRMDRAKDWKVRCCVEALRYPKDQVSFITLTYDDEHLKKCCLSDIGTFELNKKDLQIFWKRLRSRCGNSIRYFACGEYGTENGRPHFHAIVFGDAFPDKKLIGLNKYQSSILSDSWQYGFVDLSEGDPNSIAYVCGYVEKKQVNIDNCTRIVKPFVVMSRKPGIGFNYSLDEILEDKKLYGFFGSGKVSSKIPRFYKKKIKEFYPEWYEDFAVHAKFQGKDFKSCEELIFHTHDSEKRGLLKDSIMEEGLIDKRKEVI